MHRVTVTFPEGLTSIGEDAFHGCTGLTSVTFPEGLTSRAAFLGAHSHLGDLSRRVDQHRRDCILLGAQGSPR